MSKAQRSDWLVSPGQCLVCGGRDGYQMLCRRCGGTGRDPDRGEACYMDICLPVQIELSRDAEG